MVAVTSKLKPRSTVLNENEQLYRLKPNARGSGILADGISGIVVLSPNETTVEDAGVTRVRERGHLPNTLPAVSDDNGLLGEDLGNKTFQLRGGATPETPTTYALLFIDANNSILGNGGDGTVTVNYTDDTDTARVDAWTMSVDGLGPHYTTFPVKSVQSVVGTGFDAAGAGAPSTADELLFGPACPDNMHWIVGSSGGMTSGPTGDPNNSAADGDASYVTATDTVDKNAFVGIKPVPAVHFEDEVLSIQVWYFTKNLAAVTNGIDLALRIGGTIHVIGNNSITGTEGGAYQQQALSVSTNPDTSLPWKVSELQDLEVGVVFKGEGVAVEKRWAFTRVHVNCKNGYVHNSIDGGDVANIDDIWKAVDDDPFGVADDSEYVPIYTAQNSGIAFEMEDLPGETASIISITGHLRWTQPNHGARNGSGDTDMPCGIYNLPREGDESENLLHGPIDQINLGGMAPTLFIGSTIVDSVGGVAGNGRRTANKGDPSGGCGTFGTFDDVGTGYGDWLDITFQRTLNNNSQEITVQQAQDLEVGWRNIGRQSHEQRVSRLFAEVETRRNPVGGEVFPHLAVDSDPNGVPAVVDAEFVPSQHSSNKKFIFDFAGIPEASEILSVTVRVRARTSFGASQGWRVFWRTNGGDTNEAEQFNPNFSTLEFVRTLNPQTGLKWTRGEVNALQIGWESIGENDFFQKDLSALELEVSFVEIPDKVDAAKDIGSRRLRLYRRPLPLFEMEAPIQFADAGILGDIAVTHRAHPALRNAGLKRWERRLMRVLKEDFNLDNMTVRQTLLDLREFLLTFWATLRSRSRGLSFDGMAVITPGGRLKFERKTNAYYPDPNDGAINELTADEPKVNENGTAVENGSQNDIINSHFGEGSGNNFTSWVKNNDGTNGGSITEETGVTIFRDTVTTRSPLLTSGNPVTDLGLEQEMTNVPSGVSLSPVGARYVLSIDHQDIDGQPLSVQIERQAATTQFFNVATQSFQSTSVWYDLPVRALPTRDRIPGAFDRIDFGATALVDIVVRVAARTSAGQRNRVFHVQWEGGTLASAKDKTYPTSRIVTKTGPVVRDADQLFAQSFAKRLTWPTVRGTFFGIFEPFWDSLDAPARTGVLYYITGNVFNAFNHDVIYYDHDNEEFVFERQLAGVTTKATFKRRGIVAGQPIKIAARWTSEEGELDLTANTQDIFVDGVKGTAVAAAGGPNPGSSQSMFLGSLDGSNLAMADGILREFYVTQQVLTLSEIRRLP